MKLSADGPFDMSGAHRYSSYWCLKFIDNHLRLRKVEEEKTWWGGIFGWELLLKRQGWQW